MGPIDQKHAKKTTKVARSSWINDDAEKERVQMDGVQRKRTGCAETLEALEPGNVTFRVGRVPRGAGDRHSSAGDLQLT